ncbi:unnamed protein product [Bemisia tabaci]|uniref:Uncharacterized protein n=1 Tax=Bemisia tabaci TaxID=7038 RepID=A0A9N9ZXY3_BEMTA|nr:unnamed protein product [Bemisia tabaci]
MDAECFWRHSKYYVQLLIFFLALSFEFAESFDYKNNQMAPIILVPGVAGTKIEAKYHTTGHPRGCDEDSDWELIWINLKAAAGGLPLRCWVYRYRLFYDRAAHRCRNQAGVETRVVGRFGSLKPVDYLSKDPFSRIGTNYFNDMSDALKDSGYSTDINLKAAGYDGRYAPIQQKEFGYFDRFTELVEKVATDSKRKVSIVSHSMGGLVAAYFLGLKSQEWKDKYIHNFVAVSTPWLGSVFALESYILGTNYGVPTFKKSLMKELVRTFQSVAFLLPAEEAFGETVLVDWTLKNKKYTAKDYKQLFTDLQYEDGYLIREDVRSFFPVDIDKLGVKVVCIYSNLNKIETLQRYEIADDILNPKSVKSHFVEGDGTVTLNSLQHCDKFKNVTVKVFQGYDHLKIIFKDDVIDFIQSVTVNAQSL